MAVLTGRIETVVRETPRNRTVRVSVEGGVPPFDAGQYVLLCDRGQAERRPYSIACAPAQAARHGLLEFLIQVIEDESPGPHLATLSPGRLLDVEGPAGSFVLPSGPLPSEVALVGGGTGIAPLRAILWQLLLESPSTKVSVLQSARSPEELSYAGELRGLAADGRIGLLETVTRDAPASWRGGRGRADAASLAKLLGGPATLCYVCGPDSLVEGIPPLLAALGVGEANIRVEHWAD